MNFKTKCTEQNIHTEKYKYIVNFNLFIKHTTKLHINEIKYKS